MAAVGLLGPAELGRHPAGGEAQVAQAAAQVGVLDLDRRRRHLAGAVPVEHPALDHGPDGGLAHQWVAGGQGGGGEGHRDLVLAGTRRVGETRRRRAVELVVLDLADREGEVDGVDHVAPAVVAHGVEVALDGEHGHGRPPAVVEAADDVGAVDHGVGEEDLVELRVARHVPQGSDLDAGLVHVDHEEGDAPVPGGVGVGAGHEHGPVGQVATRGPHLLAVDHPGVAVGLGPGGEAGQVTTGGGLGEQLAPHGTAVHDVGQEAVGEMVGAVGEQGGGHQRDPDPVGWPEGAHVGPGPVDGQGVGVRQPPPVTVGRPPRQPPARAGQQGPPVAHGERRVPVVGEPGASLGVDVPHGVRSSRSGPGAATSGPPPATLAPCYESDYPCHDRRSRRRCCWPAARRRPSRRHQQCRHQRCRPRW